MQSKHITPHPRTVDWRDPGRFAFGTPAQRLAAQIMSELDIPRSLAHFDPVLCGTIPIDCDLPGSDLDIVCHAPTPAEFAEELNRLFGAREGFECVRKSLLGTNSVVCRFRCRNRLVEIVGQSFPVQAQRAYGHMLAEALLIHWHGPSTCDEVRRLKQSGSTTEEAFATLFGLEGDPYEALLRIYNDEFCVSGSD